MNSVPTAGAVARGESQSHSTIQDNERGKRIGKAVEFLQDQRVRVSPLNGKVQFLKSKGLSAEEMHEAFRKIGQVQSLTDIQKIMERLPSSVAPTPARSDSSRPLNSGSAIVEFGHSRDQMPSQTYNTGRLYPPEPPLYHRPYDQAREWDWRDYVIALGATVISGFAAFKAFQFYSPYEIVRKDETRVDEMVSKGASSRRRNRMNARHITSDSEGDLPKLPPPLPTPAPKAQETIKKCDQEEMTRVQEDLKEAQEALEKEKKSKAELSVTLGKLRAQTQRQSVSNDKQEAQIKALQEEIDKLQKDAESRKSTVGVVSTEVPASPLTTGNAVPNLAESPSVSHPDLTVPDAVMPVEAPTSELPVLRATESAPVHSKE